MNEQSKSTARRWTGVAGYVYVASELAMALISLSPSALATLNRLAVPEATTPERIVGLYAGLAGGLTSGFGAA